MTLRLKIGAIDPLKLRIGAVTPLRLTIGAAQVNQIAGEAYRGETTVTPRAYDKQVLETTNKVLLSDITVLEVPYFETSAASGGGMTVYIAGSVTE